MKIIKLCCDLFLERLISISVMMICFSAFAFNVYAEHDEAVSEAVAGTVTTGGESRLSFLIGIVFLAVGTVGFVLLKLRDKRLNDNTM